MTDTRADRPASPGYGRLAVVSGWAVTILYIAHSLITTNLARTDRFVPAREDLRGWHYLLGLMLLVAAVARLWAWRRDGRVAPPPGLGAGAHHFGRMLALLTYVLLVAAPLLGIFFAWSHDLTIHLGPVNVPTLMGHDYEIWMFTGYFHSGMSFMMIALNAAAVLTAGYTLLRYGRGLIAAFPPGYGVQVFVAVTITRYALVTFKSPEPGPRAVITLWLLFGAVWLVGWLIHRRRAAASSNSLSPGLRATGTIAALAVAAAGAYGPHALFRVTPWPMGEKAAGKPGATSHDRPGMAVAIPLETPFETAQRKDKYKWCRFCHTVERGGATLVGPNLYGIFGHRAGTVPNYSYSPAMAAAGRKGLVWTERTVSDFIAAPDHYIPGTSMIISSGPVTDPKERAAVVNLLKRDTMQDAQLK